MSGNMNKERIIFYVVRDIERALGMDPNPTYQIITNDTACSRSMRDLFPDHIHLIDQSTKDRNILDTWQLLEHPETEKIISNAMSGAKKDAAILVFKNTSKIEAICAQHGWNLINPSSILAERIENKMTQVEYLGDLGEAYLPPHSLTLTKDISWNKKPLIIQWAHSHTGDGTILINSVADLESVKERFPERLARVSSYIHGPSFTLNVVVDEPTTSHDGIILGNISYQITGMPPFTENPFTTIGNDWSLPHSLMEESELAFIETMARSIGRKLQSDGWKGLFGIDVMRDDQLDKIFLIEINARQPASTTYESRLQKANRDAGMEGSTIFESHISATSDAKTGSEHPQPIQINDGAQIIQRVTRLVQSISHRQLEKLAAARLNAIVYENEDENADLLRIQSSMGIMETHGTFNKRGKEILEIVSNP